MALVSKPLIDACFKKSNWVYKNFAFLYHNKLWQKTVPNGFAVCPLFWGSLFSTLLFRPFIYPILLLLNFCIGGLCKLFSPLGDFLKSCDNFIRQYTGVRNDSHIPGLSIVLVGLLSILILTAIGLLLFGVGMIIVSYWGVNATPSLFIPLIIAATFCFTKHYIKENKYNENRCNVRNYLYSALIFGSAINIFMMFEEFLIVINSIKDTVLFIVTKIINAFDYIFINKYALNIGFSFVVLAILGYIIDKFVGNTVTTEIKNCEELNKKQKNIIMENIYSIAYINTIYSSIFWDKHIEKLNYQSILEQYLKDNNYSNFRASIVKEARRYVAEFEEKEKQIKENRSKLCKKISNIFGKIISPFTWVWKQFSMVKAMGTEVIKAKKQGFCPYQKFTDD